MCRRCLRGLLLVMGLAMVIFAMLPFLAFTHFEEPLQTELMVSKLLLLPVGAICLAGATIMGKREVRH